MTIKVNVTDAKIYKVSDYGNYATTYLNGLKFVAYESSKNGSATRQDLVNATGKEVSLLEGYRGKSTKKADGTYYAPSISIQKIVLKDAVQKPVPVTESEPVQVSEPATKPLAPTVFR